MPNPFDSRARRKCLTRAVNSFHIRVAQIARDIDADIAKRGFAGMGCQHPRVRDALRVAGEVMEEMFDFERRAAEFACKQLRVRGVDDTANVYAEEQERELIAWVKNETKRMPDWILTTCRRLRGKPSALEDYLHDVELEVTERIRREYREGRAHFELEIEAARTGSGTKRTKQAKIGKWDKLCELAARLRKKRPEISDGQIISQYNRGRRSENHATVQQLRNAEAYRKRREMG